MQHDNSSIMNSLCRCRMVVTAVLLLSSLFVVVSASTSGSCAVSGKRQSPIDVLAFDSRNIIAPSLKWSSGYDLTPESMNLVNTGSTFKLTVTSSESLRLSSGLLDTSYKLQEIHFHWGDSNTKGSEHKYNGRSFPLEMHVVHSQNFTNQCDSNVVIGYLFKLSKKPNLAINNILDVALEAAERQNETINVNPFPLSELVATNQFFYYSYKGSFTTAPYCETVTWIIPDFALPISERQLKTFRRAAEIDNGLKNNFREVQKLYNRALLYVLQL